MTTPAQGNFPESSAKLEGGFEASGLSPEEAERLAASFKPSWEFDEAPFTHAAQGGSLRNGDLEALEANGYAREVHGRPDSERSQAVAAHAPPARVETHEPEVSVIIDRSITADTRAPHAIPAPAQVPAPFAMPTVAPNRVIAPVARSRFNADESLELPASALKKSNKGLFIGLGAAVAAAALVFAVRAAMSSSDEPTTQQAPGIAAATASTATAARTAATTPIPPPPPPAPAAPQPQTAPAVPQSRAAVAAPPSPRPAAHVAASPPPHHAAPPRPPPKPAGGGIVRDVPF